VPPVILSIDAPRPVIEGSLLRVTGRRFDILGPGAVLVVEGEGVEVALPLEHEGEEDELFFLSTSELVLRLGPGGHALTGRLDGAFDSEPYPFSIDVADDLPIRLSEAPAGNVHRNELWVVHGDGFLSESEGIVDARFEGTFTLEVGGVTRPVDVLLPVLPAELFARDRGIVRLTTAIGGVEPGTFDGTVTLSSRTASGGASESSTLSVALRFLPPELFGLSPGTVALEQVIFVSGAGFLGGEDEPDELTLIRMEGDFTPEGGMAVPVAEDLVLEWISGSEVRGVIRAERDGDELVSQLFGVARGRLVGTGVPVVAKGTTEVQGAPVDFSLTLGGMTQVVHLRFLPGFYASLDRFGLGAAQGWIEGMVEARMEDIYGAWPVDVRLEEPTDFSPNGYATVEIGGPDPNGVGLFGYDNTPGKDVGNLRLYDSIGGANAETQEDGYPGYGGVFVESLLYFSSHPDLPGRRPPGAPDPDPDFDDIFDPVRRNPATAGEIMGTGDPARSAQVDRALRGLASMVGETAAHELGHSLGLASPHGPRTVFHNPRDEEGCLMDSGGSRPIGERTEQEGFALTRLCGSHPEYLNCIFLGEDCGRF